jgi:hypothetical protein
MLWLASFCVEIVLTVTLSSTNRSDSGKSINASWSTVGQLICLITSIRQVSDSHYRISRRCIACRITSAFASLDDVSSVLLMKLQWVDEVGLVEIAPRKRLKTSPAWKCSWTCVMLCT